MKKIYFTTIISFLFLLSAKAQDFYQYFDGADTSFSNSIIVELDTSSSNIWQIGSPHKFYFDSAATAPNAIVTDTVNYYPANNRSTFTIKVVPPPWWFGGIFALQWEQMIDLQQDSDGAFIEFSIDSGNTWQNAFNNPYVYNFYGSQNFDMDTLVTGAFAFTGKNILWNDMWLCFDVSWMTSMTDTILFRFSLVTDSINNNREGWLIDNMIAHMTIHHTVGKLEQPEYMKVFPNPASDILHIETQKVNGFHIIEEMELFNTKGQLVEQWKNCPTKFWIDTRKYADGLYFLKVKTNLRSEMFPVVVNKGH